MSHTAEFCITCNLRLELVSRRTIETIHDIHGVDLDTMHVVATEDPKRIQYCDDIVYYLRCPKCHNSQPVTVTFG
jgi:cytochrome c-type biogenesis protein CcmH/NrfF